MTDPDDPGLMSEVGACVANLADISAGIFWHKGNVDVRNGKGQVALWSLVLGYPQLATAGQLKKEDMRDLSILDILLTIRQESGH
ncbi:hypothetical protein [Sulfitobacter sp.]|uniref:hypothetical protein n=1 Tax=Sulfitobacter sp. TaxID=1903071 RepID=UPI0030012F46